MNISARHSAALTLLILASLLFAGRTMTSRATPSEAAASIEETAPVADGGSKQEEGEVPLAVAQSEQHDQVSKKAVVEGSRNRREAIHDLVADAQKLLSDVELQYVFIGEGKNQVLRG